MNPVRIFLAVAGLIFCMTTSSNAQGWRGIRPLHSTREEVERLIGPPMQPKGRTYDLKNERVNIVYAEGCCVKGWPYGWNVKTGTVIGITIHPQPRPKLAELPIDLSKARKYVDPTGVIHYNDDTEGLSVAVDPKNYEVRVIEYYPAASEAHLRCPDAAAREREIASGESAERPAVVTTRTHHRRIKMFTWLASCSSCKRLPLMAMVHIIGYAGPRAKPGEAEARANVAKEYLIHKQRIDPKQIVVIDGGYRDLAGVDLFITLRGQPKPLASPNVYPGNVKIIKDN